MSFGLLTYDCYDNNRYDFVEKQTVVSSVPNGTIPNAAAENVATKRVERNICNELSSMDRKNYEKTTAILMILTVITLIVALICSCILQKLMPRFYWISPILAFIASLFLLVSISVYSIYTEKYFIPSLFVPAPTEISSTNNNVAVENTLLIERGIPYYFGYSFWFAFAALITTLIAAIIGFMASKNFGEETTSRFLVQSYITSAIK